MPLRPHCHRFSALVQLWYPQRSSLRWVLVSLVDAQGSAYRKPGAQLFINEMGQWFGLISGGCLEADVLREAQRVFAEGGPRRLNYDLRETEGAGPGPRLGCGGTLSLVLQALTPESRYLELEAVHTAIEAGQFGCYLQSLSDSDGTSACRWLSGTRSALAREGLPVHRPAVVELGNKRWLATPLDLPPELLIVGGGVDTRPLAGMAAVLGWRITILDARVSVRAHDFPAGVRLLRVAPEELADAELARFDAAVLMSHNVGLDARALQRLNDAPGLRYWGLLGPAHRRARVLSEAGLEESALSLRLAGPIGLQLGGELPESVALSILAEAHAALESASARSLSGLLPT